MTTAPQKQGVTDDWRFAGEYILAESPYTVRRAVRWAECDPAGVVYLGNYPHYLLSAVNLFRNGTFGIGWIDNNRTEGFQAPGKAIAMVFQSSLWPDDVFDMQVYVGEIRTRTMTLMVQARRADNGENVFAGSVTSIFVTMADRYKTITIPAETRARLEQYQRENPAPIAIAEALKGPQ
jgi:acyl-CoA thioesterase FadM